MNIFLSNFRFIRLEPGMATLFIRVGESMEEVESFCIKKNGWPGIAEVLDFVMG